MGTTFVCENCGHTMVEQTLPPASLHPLCACGHPLEIHIREGRRGTGCINRTCKCATYEPATKEEPADA